MSKEKRSELIHDALDLLDEDLIEDVDRLRGGVAESVSESEKAKKRRFNWRRFTAFAASLCVLVIGSWAWQNFHEPNSKAEAESSKDKDFMSSNQEVAEEEAQASQEKDGLPSDKREEYDMEKEDVAATQEVPYPNDVPKESENLLISYEALKENYVRISMIPHKVWVSAGSMDAATQQAVVIDTKYKADIDKLVEAMSVGTIVSTAKIGRTDPDMTYHLFFEKANGEIVHCQLLEGGYVCEDADSDWCVAIDKAVYDNVFKILALHW